MALPAPGLTLADKQTITRALLRSGASIKEMNLVRRHLSAVKGRKAGDHGATGAHRITDYQRCAWR